MVLAVVFLRLRFLFLAVCDPLKAFQFGALNATETAAKSGHDDLFRARLDQIINLKHELVILANRIDWAWLNDELGPVFLMKAARRSRCTS